MPEASQMVVISLFDVPLVRPMYSLHDTCISKGVPLSFSECELMFFLLWCVGA